MKPYYALIYFIIMLIPIMIYYIMFIDRDYEYFETPVKCYPPPEIPDNTTPGCAYQFRNKELKCPKNSRNPGVDCYDCGYIRPGLFLNEAVKDCCQYKCENWLPPKKCKPYYCYIDSLCQPRYGKRDCGYHKMYLTKAKVYDNKEQCENDVNPYKNMDMEKCLERDGRGWCTDAYGNGLCVPGTEEGPKDRERYYECYPNLVNTNRNSWTPGYTNPWIKIANPHQQFLKSEKNNL